MSRLLKTSAIVKYLTPSVIHGLNLRIKKNGGINKIMSDGRTSKVMRDKSKGNGLTFVDRNAAICQDLLNRLGARAVELRVENDKYNYIWHFLLLNCSITCISDAVDLHRDIPKKNAFMKGNEGFVETRVLIAIDFLSTFDKGDPPLGRGGGGPGVYIVALIDHPDSFRKRVGRVMDYRQFRKEQNIQLRVTDFFQVIENPNCIERSDLNTMAAIREYHRMVSEANREEE